MFVSERVGETDLSAAGPYMYDMYLLYKIGDLRPTQLFGSAFRFYGQLVVNTSLRIPLAFYSIPSSHVSWPYLLPLYLLVFNITSFLLFVCYRYNLMVSYTHLLKNHLPTFTLTLLLPVVLIVILTVRNGSI